MCALDTEVTDPDGRFAIFLEYLGSASPIRTEFLHKCRREHAEPPEMDN